MLSFEAGRPIMRIAESQINMSSRHSYSVDSQESEALNFWDNTGTMSLKDGVEIAEDTMRGLGQDTLTISEEAKENAAQNQQFVTLSSSPLESGFSLKAEDELKIKMLEAFLYQLLHKRVKLRIPDILSLKANSGSRLFVSARKENAQTAVPATGWGLTYNYSNSYREAESMTYSTQGTVKTADGKEIAFDMTMNMSRSYQSQEQFSLRLGDAARIDPLVINIDAPSAGLSNLKIDFDLNADGKKENINFLSQGSGFLALDKNGDGQINNGKELFGPSEGDGFAELADYDTDGNNWIDEGDAVFDRLSVWTKDESGRDHLLTLAEAGVGAIYLGHIDTDFTYKDSSNSAQAELASTGIYLTEGGSVNTIQHIDYVV